VVDLPGISSFFPPGDRGFHMNPPCVTDGPLGVIVSVIVFFAIPAEFENTHYVQIWRLLSGLLIDARGIMKEER
jgi:hypothetical protein